MTFRVHIIFGIVTVALFVLPGVAQTPAAGESIPSGVLRRMTAAEFQRHLDEEGARSFLRRAVKDIDPHSPEEPNYDIILEHVAEGSSGWLRVADEIAPYVDPTFGDGLQVAVADALVVNPAGVLRLTAENAHFGQACGYPFIRQTNNYLLRHQKAALSALARVHDPALAARKAACHRQLMDLPTTTATVQ